MRKLIISMAAATAIMVGAALAITRAALQLPVSQRVRSLVARAVFDKSHNRPASSARRLVIEAVYPL